MELADKIDPAEVLSHLNQLGYKNISPPQLKEFIRDLKKLIVHDQLSSSSGSLTSLSSSASDFTYFSTSESLSEQSRKPSDGCSRINRSNSSDSLRKKNTPVLRQHKLFEESSTTVNSGNTLRKGFSSTSSSLSEKCIQKENLPAHKVKTKSICEEELQEAVKPKTSFIRPWQLQGTSTGRSRTGRSDPVSLHHYYQSLWAQRKCPGEDSHADLRWVIREKMMGQDPHLYSQSVLPPGKKSNRLRL